MAKRCRVQPVKPLLPEGVSEWRGLLNRLRKKGTALLDQQCWCWGQDVRQEPNLLIDYGFTKHRFEDAGNSSVVPHRHLHKPSAYHWISRTDAPYSITLWGFGARIAINQKAVFVERFKFDPNLVAAPAISAHFTSASHQNLTAMHAPMSRNECFHVATGVSLFCAWVAEYEGWVIANAGVDYRIRCAAAWDKMRRFGTEPAAVPEAWRGMAAAMAEYTVQDANAIPDQALYSGAY